jgi:hypothetical protein
MSELTESTTGWVSMEFKLNDSGRANANVNLTRTGTTVLCHIRDKVTLPAGSANTPTFGTIHTESPAQVPAIYRPAYNVSVPAWVLSDGQPAMGYFFIGVGGQINFGLGADGGLDFTKTSGFFPITVSWSVAA